MKKSENKKVKNQLIFNNSEKPIIINKLDKSIYQNK